MKLAALLFFATSLSTGAFADNREALSESNIMEIDRQASAVALVVSEGALFDTPNRSEKGIYTRIAKNVFGLCPDQKFANEEVVYGACTGFLIAKNKLVTSPSCMNGPVDCNSKKIVFGFSASQSDLSRVSQDRLYSCTAIDGNLVNNVGGAYRIVTLDRDVEGIEVLTLDDRDVEVGDQVYSISHSHGLSHKVSTATVWEATPNWHRFRAGISAIKGSEGAPIISMQTGKVVGVQTSNLNSRIKANHFRGCNELSLCQGDECFLEILGMASHFSHY